MFLRRHLDNPLGHLVKGGLADAGGLSLLPLLVTLHPDMHLAPADTQLLADHLLAHAVMKHPHSFSAKGEAVGILFSSLPWTKSTK